MSRILPVAMAVVFGAAGFAQQRTAPNTYGSVTGFGSVLYPGVGHAPVVLPPGHITSPSFPARLGASVRGAPPLIGHPSHGRRVVVPYPVFIGGGYGGYYGGYDMSVPPPAYPDLPQYAQPAPPPVVIINQGYRPEGAAPVMRDYSDQELPEAPSGLQSYQAPVHPTPDPREKAAIRAESERPTIYLIAFKDHTILPALAYWMEGDTLNYVTQQGTPNRASIDLIDKPFSRQLNRERNVEFSLP